MKIIFSDKKSKVKIIADNPNDFWYLYRILEPGDLISGKTLRKVSVGGDKSTGEGSSSERKPVFLEITVERAELGEGTIRISGKVASGTDDVPAGVYHTFNVNEGDAITITKNWHNYAKKMLDEACKQKRNPILIVAFESGQASFAMLTGAKMDMLPDYSGNVAGKAYANDVKGREGKEDFFKALVMQLSFLEQRHNFASIVLSSPGFWKAEIKKHITPDLQKKCIYATCQGAGTAGINETIKRPEVITALTNERAASEALIVEELLANISKNIKSCYGLKHAMDSAYAGAVQQLIIGEDLIAELRQHGRFAELENIMSIAEKTGAEIHFISSEHDAGKKLKALGGIGAILRYDFVFD